MKPVSEKTFGLVIAFLLPGFICLWALSFSVPEIGIWILKAGEKSSATVGGFFYSTLASLSAGLLLSALRWLIMDQLLSVFGIKPGQIDFSALGDESKRTGFEAVVENHYRYYQYYSNTLIGILIAGVVFVTGENTLPLRAWVGVGGIALALFLGSCDSLRKYFKRAEAVLGTSTS